MTTVERRRCIRMLRAATQRLDDARRLLTLKGTGTGEGADHWITGLHQCTEQIDLITDQIEAAPQ